MFTPVAETTSIDVLKAPLTVTITNKNRLYGGANPALTYTTTGLVNGDTAQTALTGALTTLATTTSPAGNYPITQGTLGAVNYLLDVISSTLTVSKAPLTVTADDLIRKTNMANPPLTMRFSGFVNGDDLNDLNTLPTASTSAVIGSPAGTYPITLSGGGDGNYLLDLIDGILTVTDKDIPSITWNDPAPITYGVALGPKQLNATATFGGQPVAGTLTYDPPLGATLGAGNGQILHAVFTPQNLTLFAEVPGQVQMAVNKAPLTITADNKIMFKNYPVPQLTATYSGFVNGDDLGDLDTPATISTTATIKSPIGAYPIVPSGASDANYDITFVNGTLEVRRAVFLPITLRF